MCGTISWSIQPRFMLPELNGVATLRQQLLLDCDRSGKRRAAAAHSPDGLTATTPPLPSGSFSCTTLLTASVKPMPDSM